MNNSTIRSIVSCGAALMMILLTQNLSAQKRHYTSSEFNTLIEHADTVIYRYHNFEDLHPYRALIFENPLSQVDWMVDSLPRRTLFAVKTNLLYDAVTAINFEIEVPIGARYSVAAEWIFPWWLSDSRQRCFEMLCGTVEGRRWFGDRTNVEQLTGWALGVYVGGGYYDLEWDRKGYQGEHLLSGGIAGTYAHSIGENLRLEYSLGLGVLATKYREYNAHKCGYSWRLVRSRYGKRWLFGPTRCKVSLSWMLHRADKRGGRR